MVQNSGLIPMMRTQYLCILAAACCMLALGACMPATRATRTARTAGSAQAELDRARASVGPGDDRRAVVDEAERWLGTPYVYGGTDRGGVDCSGFVCNVFKSVRRKLPRVSSDIATVGQSVAFDDARPGDLVFFNTTGAGVSHVGILLGSDTFIHSSTSRGVVVSSLNEPYYHDHVLFARRILD